MGLSLEFYAGDAAAIGVDFTAIEFEGLRDGTRARAYADFSLHLSPSDLDILSEVMAGQVRVAALLLSDCLARSVGGTANESGADVVDTAWVKMVAMVNEGVVPELTGKWIRRVGAKYGTQLVVTPEAVRSVRELVRLCRLARQERLEVVHTWYL